jgi:glycosyltransferase involved in cell wall biosynthesis
MIKISVVVPSYNRAKLLGDCLYSLTHQTLHETDYEIIVVDDGSDDNTREVVDKYRKTHSNIVYARQANSGHSKARNRGFSLAKGTIIASTDDDCIVPNNWLQDILAEFKAHKEIAAVGGSFINKDTDKWNRVAYLLDFSKWFPSQKKGYVKDIPSANIAYRKDRIKNMQFADDKRIIGYKDSLFNYGLYTRGEKILFDPKICVVHRRQNALDYGQFRKIRRRRGLGFLHEGYRVHGTTGEILVKFSFLNLFCPRLILVLARCARKMELLSEYCRLFPALAAGEAEMTWTIAKGRNDGNRKSRKKSI